MIKRLSTSFALVLLLAGASHAAEPVITSKVTIRSDHKFLLNDKPFFPLDLYYAGDEIEDRTGQGLVALRQMGFNTVFYNGSLADREKMDRIAAAGLHVQYRPPGSLNSGFDALKTLVSTLRPHPALLFWEMEDEPVLNEVSFENSRHGYELMKGLDPDHPVLCIQWPDWKTPGGFGTARTDPTTLIRWGTLCDVYGFDKYPVPLRRWWYQGADIPTGWPHSIAVMGPLIQWWQTLAPAKPVLPVLQAWAWKPTEDDRDGYPTYQQSRFMAYQAVINGAAGILYYGQFHVSKPNSAVGIPEKISEDPVKAAADFARTRDLNTWFWSYFREVVTEVSRMGPLFAAPDASWKPVVALQGGTLTRPEQVEFRVKQQPGQAPVILLVNASDYPATLRIMAPPFAGQAVHCWHEIRDLKADRRGAFTDQLDPYGVRVYSTGVEGWKGV